MDTLAIQRSLTILEDRYRELHEVGEKHRQSWEAEEASLRKNFGDLSGEKEELQQQFCEICEQKEGLLGDLQAEREQKEGLLGDLQVEREQKEGLLGDLQAEREQKEGLLGDLQAEREQKEGLLGELNEAREEAELCLLQLHQVQEELEQYFLELQSSQVECKFALEESARKDVKLAWLRNQRELLIGFIKYQTSVFQRFTAISVRLMSALSPTSQTHRSKGLPRFFRPLKSFLLASKDTH